MFQYPPDIRKAIYTTTNAIESLNSVIRKATKQRKVFPTNQSAMKVVYLAISAASKKWTMPYIKRQTDSAEILNAFKQWLDDTQQKVAPRNTLGKAVNYTLKIKITVVAYFR